LASAAAGVGHHRGVTAAPGSDDPRALVSQLWEHHLRDPFPARLRGEELAGVDMVMLDADVAGCVDTWLHGSGPLDRGRLACYETSHMTSMASCRSSMISTRARTTGGCGMLLAFCWR
jgi:hypothetical protein